MRSSAVTLSGTWGFPADFANTTRLSVIDAYGLPITGSATGKRCDANSNAVIFTGGGSASHLPGSVIDATATLSRHL